MVDSILSKFYLNSITKYKKKNINCHFVIFKRSFALFCFFIVQCECVIVQIAFLLSQQTLLLSEKIIYCPIAVYWILSCGVSGLLEMSYSAFIEFFAADKLRFSLFVIAYYYLMLIKKAGGI